jgi:uncharacterized protein YdeI (YjbR/CyaY-like superfamily)
MGTQDPRIDAYIAHSAEFARPVLTHLRKLVHTACPEVVETMKWSHPHFDYKGIMCHMAAFKQHCSFGFWKGSLIPGLAKTSGGPEKEGMGHFGRITALTDLPKDKLILVYLKEAVQLNEAGIKVAAPTKSKAGERKALVVPPALAAALKSNKKARLTFAAFSYSHKKEYVDWITGAKTEPTRQKRLATTIEWLAEGKPHNWK